MKKTLIVTIEYPPMVGGVATYWKQIMHSIPQKDLLLLTNVVQPLAQERVIYRQLLSNWFWPKWFRGFKEIADVCKQRSVEQLVVGQLLPVGTMVFLLHKLFGIPYLVQIYGMDLLQAKQKKRKWFLAKMILRSSKSILVNSVPIKELVKKEVAGIPEIQVIYPTTKTSSLAINSTLQQKLKQTHQLQGKKIVLSIARLVPRKGQDITLDSMVHVWQKYPETIYVIVGDGPDRERLEKIAVLHKNQVIFTGLVSDAQRDAWLSLADLFVMPARSMPGDIEGFGIVYTQAYAAGLPVVAGNTGGATDVVLNNQTGLLVDPESADEVAQAILSLLADEEWAKSLGKKGRERLQNDLKWEKQIAVFLKALI